MQRKILFVSDGYNIFDNIDCGASNRSTMFVKALSQIGAVDVVSFCKETIKSNIDNCEVIYQKYITDKHVGFLKKKLNRIRFLFCPWSPYAYFPINNVKESIVCNIIDNGGYDYVACRYINVAATCGLLKYSDRLIIDVDDNLSSAAKRDMANQDYKTIIHKWLACRRVKSLGIMSKYVLSKTKHSFCSNFLELPYDKSVFLPNITMQKEEIPPLKNFVPKRLLAVGWLDFYPNKYGTFHFAKNVMPLILEQVPDAELHVVGKCTDSEFMQELNRMPGVKALGYIKDLSTEYRDCGVIIIPVYQGAGSSVKFVEGLMMNRPMVSTPMGVRGFEYICKNGTHYLLANNDMEFAKQVVTLLKSVTLSKSIANAAHEVGLNNFSQDNFINIVKSELSR